MGPVGITIENGSNVDLVVHKCIYKQGIELAAALFHEQRQGIFDAPCFLVWAPRREGVENIGNTDNSTEERDIFSAYPYRIPHAVIALMVGKRNQSACKQEGTQ